MWNFAALDTTPPNSPLSPFSASCHPQTVKYHNENPLSCHPLPLKLLPTCENIGLQSHLHPRNSQAHSSAPNLHPRHSPDAPPATPQTLPQPHPHSLPTPKSHVIPPGPHSPVARKPRNINDLISKPETPSGELRAKLLSTCHGSTSRRPPRSLDTHTRTTGAAGVEGAGGTGGHGRASRRGAERSEVA